MDVARGVRLVTMANDAAMRKNSLTDVFFFFVETLSRKECVLVNMVSNLLQYSLCKATDKREALFRDFNMLQMLGEMWKYFDVLDIFKFCGIRKF